MGDKMAPMGRRSAITRVLAGTAALLVAAAVWAPLLHLFYVPGPEDGPAPDGVPARARMLAEYHLQLWGDKSLRIGQILAMRESNAEWDFMGRTFLACALANMALRQEARKEEALGALDTIIDETLRLEAEEGMYHFLMPYARYKPFVVDPPRSLFIDGEIALVLAHRLAVAGKPRYREALGERIDLIVDRMEHGPVLSAESYPDECWTFCNTVALGAVAMADRILGEDHGAFLESWVATARKKLVDPGTGLLVSSYTYEGKPLDGPEGSSIWMAASMLRFVDEAFAEDQYRRAEKELRGSLFGFGYAREWPASWKGPADIDSGPVIPVLGASPGSSGLALLGAASFGDTDYARELMTSLELAAFPSVEKGRLRYHASNLVGDAVLLYALLQGPVWRKLEKGEKR